MLACPGELHNLTERDFESLHLTSDTLTDSFSLLKLRQAQLWTVARAEPLHPMFPLHFLFFGKHSWKQ